MEIKAGRYYKLVNGDTVEMTEGVAFIEGEVRRYLVGAQMHYNSAGECRYHGFEDNDFKRQPLNVVCEVAAPGFKIEAGKHYVTAGGDIVGPLDEEDDYLVCEAFKNRFGGPQTWKVDGSVYLLGNGEELHHLVREVRVVEWLGLKVAQDEQGYVTTILNPGSFVIGDTMITESGIEVAAPFIYRDGKMCFDAAQFVVDKKPDTISLKLEIDTEEAQAVVAAMQKHIEDHKVELISSISSELAVAEELAHKRGDENKKLREIIDALVSERNHFLTEAAELANEVSTHKQCAEAFKDVFNIACDDRRRAESAADGARKVLRTTRALLSGATEENNRLKQQNVSLAARLESVAIDRDRLNANYAIARRNFVSKSSALAHVRNLYRKEKNKNIALNIADKVIGCVIVATVLAVTFFGVSFI